MWFIAASAPAGPTRPPAPRRGRPPPRGPKDEPLDRGTAGPRGGCGTLRDRYASRGCAAPPGGRAFSPPPPPGAPWRVHWGGSARTGSGPAGPAEKQKRMNTHPCCVIGRHRGGADRVARPAAAPAAPRPSPQTARRWRPLARRAARTLRPPLVRERTRKPWVRLRRTTEGLFEDADFL